MLKHIKHIKWMSILTALVIGGSLATGAKAQNLMVYCPMSEDDCGMMLSSFEADTGIKSSYMRVGAGEIVARIRAEKENPQAGLWLAGAADNFIQAAKEGLLAPYKSAHIDKIDPTYVDKDNFWTPISRSPLVLIYSEAVLNETGAPPPTGWQSFADPAYKEGGIALAHPAASGTAYIMLGTLVQHFGEDEAFDLMKKMDTNVVQYTRSGTAPSRMVASDEVALAVAFTQDVESALKQGYKLAYVFPEEGDGFEVNAAAAIAGASEEQQKQAKSFLDWILTENGQIAMGKTFRSPIVTEYGMPDAQIDVSHVKLIDYDFAWAGENRARLLERYEREVRRGAEAK